jgi:enamine deaminase RidA (YjgF/YER057c/UK114 family)
MTVTAQYLASLGIRLPTPAKPVANYVGWVKAGNLVFVSGQLPLRDGELAVKGIMGNPVDGISVDDAVGEARQCAINILAQVNAACEGDLSRVKQVVKLTGFVASTPTFTDHPKIINGASDVMVMVFGEAGKHTRAAVGVASLPMNACVEVEAVVELH